MTNLTKDTQVTTPTPELRLSRRQFLAASAALVGSRWAGTAWSLQEVLADSKSASVVNVAPGVWAVLSKPLEGGFDTLCNGGIVAGEERVLAFDSYARASGAEWVINQTRELTGRAPTDLVLSHHHGDHVGGIGTFAQSAPDGLRVWLTDSIRDAISSGQLGAAKEALEGAQVVAAGESAEVDLGGSSVTLSAHSGHTASDLVALATGDSSSVLFAGDLVWNRLFPNYMDARPMELKPTVAKLLEVGASSVVPGHGPIPSADELQAYAKVLDAIEELARRGHEAGKTAAEATEGFALPGELGEWTLFNPAYFQTAVGAWYKQLG